MNDSHAIKPHLTREHLLALLRAMVRIRRFEEKCAELYQQEKIRGFLHLYIGEEAIAVGAMQALAPADAVVATYREHGHALARGVSMDAVMAEMYGKAEGCSRGRGGSMHLFDAATRFYGGNAIVGGGLPLAVGLGAGREDAASARASPPAFLAKVRSPRASSTKASIWPSCGGCRCCSSARTISTPWAPGSSARSRNPTSTSRRRATMSRPKSSTAWMSLPSKPRRGASVRRSAAVAGLHSSNAGPIVSARIRCSIRSFIATGPRSKTGSSAIRSTASRSWMREMGTLHDTDLTAIEAQVDAEIEQSVGFAESGHWEPVAELARDVYAGEGAP